MVRKYFWSRLLILIGVFVFLSILWLTINGSGETITVDDNGEADYSTIQDAIDASQDGDTVRVYKGMYNESLSVNVSINLLGFLSEDYPIINTLSESHGIQVTADNVTISYFVIFCWDSGIHLENADHCIISQNMFKENWIAIKLSNSNSNRIDTNHISNSTSRGISLDRSNENSIHNNSVFGSEKLGIHLWDSNSNDISNNNCSHNDEDGISIRGSTRNNIEGNYLYANNRSGIYINGPNNDFRYNTMRMNMYGMEVTTGAKGTNVAHNNFESNILYGLYVFEYLGESVDAVYNWWGHETGPFNAEYNPNGYGDNVSILSNVKPWLSSPYGSDPDEEKDNDDLPLVILLIILLLILLSILSLLIYFTLSKAEVNYLMEKL